MIGKYFPSSAEEVPGGRTTAFLQEMAKKLKVFLCGSSIPEAGEDGLYNTSLLFDAEGRLLLKHGKMHLFHINVPGRNTF